MDGVELVAGHVRVGGATFPGGPRPDGRIAVLGARVRRLRLGERDELVALACGLRGTDPVAALASWVLAAAVSVDGSAGTDGLDGLDGLDDERAAALAAVALHLAGAGRDGALARTRLLASHGAGAAHDLAAADADALADELAHALTHGTGTAPDDGWTRIELAVAPAGRTATPDSQTPAAVRDRLASALLDRAHAPLDPDLAVRLLQTVGPATDRGAWSTPATTTSGTGTPDVDHAAGPAHVAAPGPAAAPSPAAHAYGPGPGTTSPGPHGPGAPARGRAHEPTGARERAARTDHAGSAPAGTRPPTGVPAGPARTDRARAADVAATSVPGRLVGPAHDDLAVVDGTPTNPGRDRWGSPVGQVGAHRSPEPPDEHAAGPAASSDRWTSVATVPSGSAPAAHPLPARLPLPTAPTAPAVPVVPEMPDATGWSTLRADRSYVHAAADGHRDPSAATPDADALALALHRAADLRGVRR